MVLADPSQSDVDTPWALSILTTLKMQSLFENAFNMQKRIIVWGTEVETPEEYEAYAFTTFEVVKASINISS